MSSAKETTLASFGQLNRDSKFRIITKIVERNSRLSVRKEAYSNDANFHIKNIRSNHEILKKSTSKLLNISVAKIIGSADNYIEFEYIKGQNLENEIFNRILSSDYNGAIELLDRVLKLLDNLTTKRGLRENEQVKKINDIYQSDGKDYVNPGIIDLNPDNFILQNNGELVAFDCEWIFNQPISINYLKTRLLHTFFARRSNAFKYLPSEFRAFVTIEDSNMVTFIPEKIFKYYSHYLSKEKIKKYWKAEDIFQSYVNKYHVNNARANDKIFKKSKTTTPEKTFPENDEILASRYNTALSRILELESALAANDSKFNEVSGELARIKLSRSYKAAKKLGSAKRRLIG